MIGYACLSEGYRDYSFKKLLEKNVSKENLEFVIKNNLKSLEKLIDYNERIEIKMFRITSDLIPFGNKYLDIFDYRLECRKEFEVIGSKIKAYKMRVSMHPGQYTVLNSNNKKVVDKAKYDLNYHADILNLLKTDVSNKIILHIGGVYGDKPAAIDRFIKEYKTLTTDIKDRLVIENDHISYNVDDILYIGKTLAIPMVFDNLHNEILKGERKLSESEIIDLFSESWQKKDGRQKIHYSQQGKDKVIGGHSRTIDLEKFKSFYDKIDREVDIMLEVKDKDLSAIKCNNLLVNTKIVALEREWSKYKYNILEHSPRAYEDIRKLLKDKSDYPVLDFYKIIDDALEIEIEKNKFVNAFEHTWGYFKNLASTEEKTKKDRYLKRYLNGSVGEKPLKKFILKLAEKYEEDYLLESYYFNF